MLPVQEKTLLAIKRALAQLGLLQVSESMVRALTPAGQRLNAHRRQMIDFYGQFIHPGDLCFDIGANLGSRVEVFLALGATVVAVEPQDSCMDYLRVRFGKNPKVHLIHAGLDEKEGTRELLINRNDSPTASMSRERITTITEARHLTGYTWDKTEVVQVTTLDNLIAQFGTPAFCKIDVEGFEYQVLKGLSKPIPTLSFEYVSDFLQPALDCVDHLAKLGAFEFNHSSGESMTFALSAWVDEKEIRRILSTMSPDDHVGGDIYARLIHRSAR
jgi:FkbM family methyltransferase